MNLQEDARKIISYSIFENLPNKSVETALLQLPYYEGDLYIIAIGKAAYTMSLEAERTLGSKIKDGVCITKYGFTKQALPHFTLFEAGHPIIDENTIKATQYVEFMVSNLNKDDLVVFLVSGGASIFEDPYISLEEFSHITNELLYKGANTLEINTIRKRLSKVKAGRFANLVQPARLYSIVLSDMIEGPLDQVAGGPFTIDSTTAEDAFKILKKYDVQVSSNVEERLKIPTPISINNLNTIVIGNNTYLCNAAKQSCRDLGYQATIVTTTMTSDAKDAALQITDLAKQRLNTQTPLAYIFGGETTVKRTGDGLGGRNMELALKAAMEIEGLDHVCIFAFTSDGIEAKTDAAGGIVDGTSIKTLKLKGYDPNTFLQNNDSYHALELMDALIRIGPTGTCVNDLVVVLIQPLND